MKLANNITYYIVRSFSFLFEYIALDQNNGESKHKQKDFVNI